VKERTTEKLSPSELLRYRTFFDKTPWFFVVMGEDTGQEREKKRKKNKTQSDQKKKASIDRID
jgi:hypothetical protein